MGSPRVVGAAVGGLLDGALSGSAAGVVGPGAPLAVVVVLPATVVDVAASPAGWAGVLPGVVAAVAAVPGVVGRATDRRG